MRGKRARRVLFVGAGACAVVAGFALVRAMDGPPGDTARPGSDRSAAVAAEAGPPPAPRFVTTRPTGRPGELAVAWSAPVGADVTGYRVVVEGGPTVEVPPDATSATVTGLADGEAAAVVVTATTPEGDGPAAAVPGTPRSLGAGACSGATITWDGGASTTAWSDGLNWDLDRVPVLADHVCIPDAADVVVAATRPKVASLASAGALTLTAGLEATDPLTPSLLSTTGWTGGDLIGSIVVVEGETLTASSSGSAVRAHLAVAGTLRVQAWTTVACTPGVPSGVEVTGTVELAGDVGLDRSGATTCTPTAVVRPGGAMRKTAGTGTSASSIAVVNEGDVETTTGTLSLVGGSVTTAWTGATSGPEAATVDGVATGTYTGVGTGVIRFGGSGSSSTGRRTHHLGAGSELAGTVALATNGTLTGVGTVAADGVLTVGSGGWLDAALDGGTILLQGGDQRADVLPGVAREWHSGTLAEPFEIATGATVRVLGYVTSSTAVVNRGTVRVEGAGLLYVRCQAGVPSGFDNRGLLTLLADGAALQGSSSGCTAVVWNRPEGEVRKAVGTGVSDVWVGLVNEGLVRVMTGRLALRTSSSYVDWTGTVGSSTGPGAASGEYRADSGAVIAFGGPTSGSARAAHAWATSVTLRGQLEIVSRADVVGTSASVTTSGVITVAGGKLAVSLAGGQVTMTSGTWAAGVRPGISRVWSGGEVDGSFTVSGSAALRITGPVSGSAAIENAGSVRIEGAGQLTVICQTGQASGFDNRGLLDLARDGAALSGSASGCTPLVWNRAAGEIRRSAGAGVADVWVGVVNQGLVRAQTGRLVLRSASAWADWTGVAGSASGPGAATGEYRGEGGIVAFEGPTNGSGRAVHAWSASVALAGDLAIAGRGDVVGTTADLAPTGVLTVSGGSLDVAVAGGTVHTTGGVLKADVMPGVERTWTSGSISEDVQVHTGATVRVTGQLSVGAAIVNHGTVRVETGGLLLVSCAPGRSSGFENRGLVDLAVDGAGLSGSGSACTPTLWNAAGGEVRKSGGTGASDVWIALVNHGLVRAQTGRLALHTSSAWVDRTGVVGSGSGDGAATGEYRGEGGIVSFEGSTGWSDVRAVHAWAPSVTLTGDLAIAGRGDVIGTTASLASTGTLTVQGGSLDVAVSGGTVHLAGGILKADVLPGVGRTWSSGSLADIVEVDGAIVRVTGYVWGGGALVNRGEMRFEGVGQLITSCAPGRPSGFENHGTIDLTADGAPLSGSGTACTPVLWNASGGEVRKSGGTGESAVWIALVNHGVVRAEIGRLALHTSSAWIDRTGVAGSGSGTGAATGEYRGEGSGVVSFEGSTGWTDIRGVHAWAPSVTLAGNLTIAGRGDVVGTTADLAPSGVLTVTGGSLDVAVAGGRVRMTGGQWKADVRPGVERTWSGGWLGDDVTIEDDVVVDVTGHLQTHTDVVNEGTVRIAAGAEIVVFCDEGASTGIRNVGLIDLLADGDRIYAVVEDTCRAVLENGAGGVVRKSGGTGETGIWVAFENQAGGLVTATTGKLSLRWGSRHGAIDGAGELAHDGAAGGTFEGAGGTVAFGGPTGWSGDVQVFTWSPTVTLKGQLEILPRAEVRGTGTGRATLSTGARLLIGGGTLRVAVGGGKVRMTSGTWAADIRAGETQPDEDDASVIVDRSRLVEGGSIGTVDVVAGATLVIEGQAWMPDHATLENHGIVKIAGSAGYPLCATCTFLNHDGASLDLVRDVEGLAALRLTPQGFYIDRGTFTNHGLVRQVGEFPGVAVQFGPNVDVTAWGEGQWDITMPEWLVDLESSGEAAALASGAQGGDLLGGIIRNVAAYFVDNGIAGRCTNGSYEVALSAQVQLGICTVTDGNHTDAVALTFGGGFGFIPGQSVVPGNSWDVDTGSMVGRGVGTTITTGTLEGLSTCGTGQGTLASVGVVGTLCTGIQTGEPYDLRPGSADGTYWTLYAGLSLSTDVVEGGAVVSLSYTVVVDCLDILSLTGVRCPVPPKIEGLSRHSGQPGIGTLTITGKNLDGAQSVTFEQTQPNGSVRTCTASGSNVLSVSWSQVVVNLPSCTYRGDFRVVVRTATATSEPRTDPEDRVFTLLEPPPG